MTNTLQNMLGMFELGSGEMAVLKMMALVLAMILGMALLLLVFTGIAWLIGRLSGQNQPATSSPIGTPQQTTNDKTAVIGKCPKCGSDLKADLPEGLCPACLLQHGFATEGGVPPGSSAFTPPPLAELAKLFPQFEILEIIGQGGMGAVYKARQPALDRFVALKILAPRSGGDLDFSGRFSREARALAKLSHPNIVGVYDFGQIQRSAEASSGTFPSTLTTTQSLSYFIMEFVDGPNLRQLEQAKKLTPREALQIIPQICGALQFAHDEGIVHRDIKPENVLIDKKGRVKIADFGLAKILGQEADFRLTGARDVMGTPHYMAPEQVEKPQEVDHRADIYSLGVVFYEMLTGDLPIGKFDPPSHKVQIDVRLDDVVLRSLANNPDRRYQHVSEIKTEVETISATSAAQNPAPNAARSANFAPGWEYKSARTLFGLPLLHVSGGINPATGKANVSQGVFAFGQIAKGLYASGGRAYGLVAFGGVAAGLISFGGIACGAVALGGLALGVLTGGGFVAGAAGFGPLSLSVHHINDVRILAFAALLFAFFAVGASILHVLVHLWARKRATMNTVSAAGGRPSMGLSEGKLFALALIPLLLATVVLAVVISLSKHKMALRQNGPVTAEIHYQIFECDASLVDQLIPPKQRKDGMQAVSNHDATTLNAPPLAGYKREDIKIRTPGVIDTESSVATVSTRALETLLDGVAPNPGFLVDSRKVISSANWLPGIPESWIYDQTEGRKNGPGEGAGYLGVRRNNGRLELRIEYELRHTFEPDPLAPTTRLASHFLFQDRVPRTGALVFLMPFVRGDNSRHYLVVAYQISETPQTNGALADSEPTNLEAPAHPHPPGIKSIAVAPLSVLKTIVLVRATNGWIDASNNSGTVTLWTDSELQPGETLLALVKREDIGLRTNRSIHFVHQRSDKTTFSTSFSWYFGGTMAPDFNQTEAAAAVAQLNENFTDRPTTLAGGKPKKLFSVTNSSDGVMTGFIDFERALPAPMKPGIKPEAIIHIRHFTSTPSSPGVDYSATAPPGYALRAISTTGEGYTFSPSGPNEYHSSWMNLPQLIRPLRSEPGQISPPRPPSPPKIISVDEWEVQRKALENQFQELQDQGPVSVVLGEPKQMFAITNGAGEVFQGFLELVGPETGGSSRPMTWTARPPIAKNKQRFGPQEQGLTNIQAIDPITGRPSSPRRAEPLSPEERAIIIEMQRVKFRTAPTFDSNSNSNN